MKIYACKSCGHERVHHFGAADGVSPARIRSMSRLDPSPNERRCWVYRCRCRAWSSGTHRDLAAETAEAEEYIRTAIAPTVAEIRAFVPGPKP